MIKLATVVFLTLAGGVTRGFPSSSAFFGVGALFMMMGLFVCAVATLNAVKTLGADLILPF